MGLNEKDMEFVRGAEERIHRVAKVVGVDITPLLATAILVELRSMLSVGKSIRNVEIAEQVFNIRLEP